MINKIILLLLFPLICFSQDFKYSSLLLPKELTENSNSVIREQKIEVTILSQKAMTIKKNKIITVLNSKGLNSIDAIEYYDKSRKVKSIEAIIYNSIGKEIKKIKQKDFKDNSVADGFSVYNDNRVLYLDYTPIGYPFTVVYSSEVETSNTAFIPSWTPVENFYQSIEESSFVINCKSELNLKFKELNFSDKLPIEKETSLNQIKYTSKKLPSIKNEELMPSYKKIFPIVYFGLEQFQLENVDGKSNNWLDFGKWYYEALLADTEAISEETKNKMKQLVGNEKDKIKIAKIIYNYVQEKTRYVSIQVGIGGWKPMLASDVDKLGYGDCKALTNYTRSLLKSVGVDSYYSVVWAGNEKNNIDKDLASIQGNHVILSIPVKDNYLWLECTSQTQPFGFQGDFTDDRDVLVIKPEGGEIVKTKFFSEVENLKKTIGSYSIDGQGTLSGKVKIYSYGLQYDNESNKERLNREEQIERYSDDFSTINNLKIKQIKFNNDKEKIEFIEDLDLEAANYANNSNNKLMFVLNAFNQETNIPKKHRVREFPFEIKRGSTEEEVLEISYPAGYSIEAMPSTIEIDNEFGYYKIEFLNKDSNLIICKRKYILKQGFYEKEKYESFRKFKETISRTDNSKIILNKL